MFPVPFYNIEASSKSFHKSSRRLYERACESATYNKFFKDLLFYAFLRCTNDQKSSKIATTPGGQLIDTNTSKVLYS